MPEIQVDPAKVKTFKTGDAFYAWLSKNHAKEREVWIKIHKVGSGLKSITPKEAIDAVLCWGWIDGVRKSFDERSFLQRYSPRSARSIWSQINVENVSRLVREGRMTDAGLREVDRAKADGRWARAYASGQGLQIPDDLRAAIEAEPKARAMVKTLSAQNRYAIAFRTHNMKTKAGREKKIADIVAMLVRGETFYPQGKK
jgi:uncharacterized protein YdeI (YjbR/CyaY-like superfamily)